MTSSLQPKLRIKSMIPVFQLMSADGKAVNIWDFKGFRHMVLVFMPLEACEECMRFLQDIRDHYPEYEDERAVILPIVRGDVHRAVELRDELRAPFSVLYDPTGAVTRQYTDALPAVFVADKFGQLYAEWIVGPCGTFPSSRQVLDAVELINLECPECGAPLDWD